MAFRALLFSKSPETNEALTNACQGAGIALEVCSDIFSAIEKATKLTFSCILADWSDQPEAGFLFKRARESSQNVNVISIAIVEHDPSGAEMRDNRLDFLLYRPVFAHEAQDVLTRASEKMQPAGASAAAPSHATAPASDAVADASSGTETIYQGETSLSGENQSPATADDPDAASAEDYSPAPSHRFSTRQVCAAVLAIAAVLLLWNSRDALIYLVLTRESKISVLKDAVAALFYLTPSGATSTGAAGSDSQQDAYFSRSAPAANTPTEQLSVVATEGESAYSLTRLPKASDFPLPVPTYVAPVPVSPPPVRAASPPQTYSQRGTVPDSLRTSAHIAPPVVVTTTPAQMMPVSMPSVPLPPAQVKEPVPLPEEAARALLLHAVNPTYPPEAAAQKLKGPVVLQATIGRDGSVEDLKIIRGSFLLSKAAIAAVKQWRFQPYSLDGHAAQTQTVLTINFPTP